MRRPSAAVSEDDPEGGGAGGVALGDSNPGLSRLNALITETQDRLCRLRG